MVMYAKIRRMHFREHLTISEIQRRTSLSRNTIKKWLRGGDEPRQQRRNRDSKLTPFEPVWCKNRISSFKLLHDSRN